MQEEKAQVSSDLIRWLKLLALPQWAKFALALIMLLALSNALGLLIWGMLSKDKEAIAAAVSVLTVALPTGLIVVALVFGDGGARKLKEMTLRVLNQDVPLAIRENLRHGDLADTDLSCVTQGYICDYKLTAKPTLRHASTLSFRLELNVKKVNALFWLETNEPSMDARALLESRSHWRACWMGAEREGYVLNPVATLCADTRRVGVVFIKALNEDFLLEPAQRLYFAQDFAFFVRGMLEAELQHHVV